MDPLKSDHMYHANLEAKEIDIDIRCLKREELPEQVRPNESQKKKPRAIPTAMGPLDQQSPGMAPITPGVGAPGFNGLSDQ